MRRGTDYRRCGACGRTVAGTFAPSPARTLAASTQLIELASDRPGLPYYAMPRG
jgi:hypothetical protein